MCYNINARQMHSAKLKKPDTKSKLLYDSIYMTL